MGLITKQVTVKLGKGNRNKYDKSKYDTTQDEIIVDVEDIPYSSNIMLKIQCDYCGKIFETSRYKYYNMTTLPAVHTCVCKDCKYIKIQDCVQKKYGVKHVSSLESTKKKHKETIQEKYGVDNISQVAESQQKKIKTSLRKYGKSHHLKNKEILQKQINTNIQRYGVKHVLLNDKIHEKAVKTSIARGKVRSSKAQRYLCELYDGILNYAEKSYALDILLDNKIYIEYNGSGHKLMVDRGQITEKEFIRRETARYKTLKKLGYKMIMIDNYSDKLPDDETLLNIKNYCIDFLTLFDDNWIKIDLDRMEVHTKNS